MPTATRETGGPDTPDIRSLALELKRESEASMVSASQLMERLRHANSIQDVVLVQTLYMKTAFESYSRLSHVFSDLLMSMPVVSRSEASDPKPAPRLRHVSDLTARFELLSQEAERGATDVITGLSVEDRRKALFNVES